MNEEALPGPCLRGACGTPQDQHAAVTGLNVFIVPVIEGVLGPAPASELAKYGNSAEEDLAIPPATPPPRRS